MEEMKTLRAFVRLVELGTFSSVANELRVSQSTVSKWIAALEEELGVRLVDRTTRSLHVTETGQRLYRRSVALISDLDSAIAEARQDASELRGHIRVSLPVVFGQRVVVPILAGFLRQHELIELELVFSDRYVGLVDEGFDVAIRVGIPVDSALQSHKLGGGTRHLVAAPDYLSLAGTPRHPADLESHQCLVHTARDSRHSWSFERAGEAYSVRVGGRVTANNSESTLFLAKGGFGIALLADWLVERDLQEGHLVELLEDYQAPPAPVSALTAPGRMMSPRIRALIDYLRTNLGERLSGRAKSRAVTPS
ncbi:MAG: LysR family transcriptional regulator [Myxococcales bacterium]|nr:LysR family transcriptional regulator [Myxococcales bacterium]